MKILLIVQPDRFDFYSYLQKAENVEWVLLWYEKPAQMKLSVKELPLNFSEVYSWQEFATPKELIQRIAPDKIIFFEIIDLRQIALIVTANNLKIPTFYLEHGAAGDKGTAIERWKEVEFSRHKLPYLIKRFRESFFDVLKSKFFYYSVTSGFHSADSLKKYAMLPFRMMQDGPNKVLAHNHFKERVPAKSIVFNRANLEEYSVYTGTQPEDALFTGVPFFDKYFKERNVVKDHIVYIEHPHLEEGSVGWTKEHHKNVAEALFDFAEKRNLHLYIKLHPKSNLSYWNSYKYNKDLVKVIQAGDYTDLYLESKLILSYSSSLLTGCLCARKNIVLLGWHPEPRVFGADFSAFGLCHVSLSPSELHEKFDYWIDNNLTLESEDSYNAFLERFNVPFDGQATSRVLEVIST
ncbi:hypothetical protein TH63_02800 [Rufibacter radiotolerans]|uniref:Uncharacterized protein n=1 Tax=Rufibacter radiotolerans TaxID=1379910 RepID=A0A0H4VLL3_9BACT|nr:CDP-glycerol glycerophosphotransferase family protein [Rufibacter radiotolerans]AKQ44797.1 hypothetical protein TH63_02800 [Rufibacter radiotolerans]